MQAIADGMCRESRIESSRATRMTTRKVVGEFGTECVVAKVWHCRVVNFLYLSANTCVAYGCLDTESALQYI